MPLLRKLLIPFLLLLVLGTIGLSNFTLLNLFLPPPAKSYRYASDHGAFEMSELGKGHAPTERVILYFQYYKMEEKKPELVLYRRFYRKWWQFWNWADYLFQERWTLPYAESDEKT